MQERKTDSIKNYIIFYQKYIVLIKLVGVTSIKNTCERIFQKYYVSDELFHIFRRPANFLVSKTEISSNSENNLNVKNNLSIIPNSYIFIYTLENASVSFYISFKSEGK